MANPTSQQGVVTADAAIDCIKDLCKILRRELDELFKSIASISLKSPRLRGPVGAELEADAFHDLVEDLWKSGSERAAVHRIRQYYRARIERLCQQTSICILNERLTKGKRRKCVRYALPPLERDS